MANDLLFFKPSYPMIERTVACCLTFWSHQTFQKLSRETLIRLFYTSTVLIQEDGLLLLLWPTSCYVLILFCTGRGVVW